jgi:hypothetical protein
MNFPTFSSPGRYGSADRFAIPVEPAHPLPEGYQEKLKSTRQVVADICRLVIVLGFLLDGRLSRRERRQLGRLRQQGVLDVAYADLETYRRSFVDGQGLGEVTARFLDHRRAVPTDHP